MRGFSEGQKAALKLRDRLTSVGVQTHIAPEPSLATEFHYTEEHWLKISRNLPTGANTNWTRSWLEGGCGSYLTNLEFPDLLPLGELVRRQVRVQALARELSNNYTSEIA